MIGRRRQLRAKSSKPEEILWNLIKNGKMGTKFRRQYSIQSYVIDYFSPDIRLAIEIDGRQHQTSESIKYDTYRDSYLNALDIKVMRIPDSNIFRNLNEVFRKIKRRVSLLT